MVDRGDDSATIRREFEMRQPTYGRLKEEANFVLSDALSSIQDLKLHSVSSRVKEVDSFIDKVVRKEYKRPFEEVEDIVGLRIVALFLSDLPDILTAIRQHFDVVSEENKVEGSGDEASFGYMSVHFIARIKDSYAGPRYDSIKGLHFEIQIRTILMDAWANVSHYLDYKGESSVPTDLRRDFYALMLRSLDPV